jgi:hypothetical protein
LRAAATEPLPARRSSTYLKALQLIRGCRLGFVVFTELLLQHQLQPKQVSELAGNAGRVLLAASEWVCTAGNTHFNGRCDALSFLPMQ